MLRKDLLRVALSCAVIVGSISFSKPSFAEIHNVDNGNAPDSGNTTSIRDTSLYKSGDIINITNNITLWNDLPTLSSINNFTIQGNNFTVDGQNTDQSYNYGYTISGASDLLINDITFTNMSKDINAFQGNSVNGATLDIQDAASKVVLSGVNINNSNLTANTATVFVSRSAYGGAISNYGSTLSISGSNISNNSTHTTYTRYLANKAGNSYGGALYNEGDRLTIDTTTFSNNSALSDTKEMALGGAIYSKGNVTLAGGTVFSNNTDGSGANDIYFESGNLLVNGSKSDETNKISSGLASKDATSSVIISNGGNLLLNGDNTRFNGNATIGANSSLTYGGTAALSILDKTTITGNGGSVGLDLNDAVYRLQAGKFVTNAGINGKFIKSGDGTVILDNGDYSTFSGDVVINDGTLNFAGDNYINATSNTINSGASLVYTSDTDNDIYNIQGDGDFIKNGTGNLVLNGADNNKFTGEATINGGDFIYESDNGTFFDKSSTVNINGSNSSLVYTAGNTENLSNNNFASVNLKDGGAFNYSAETGTTTIGNFYTSLDGNNTLTFNGSTYSEFILNTDFAKSGTGIDTITFNNASIGVGNTTKLNNNIILDNSLLNLMDSQSRFTKTDLIFDSLEAKNNSKLNIDIFVQDSTSDTITVNSGSGILNINSLSFGKDFGTQDEFTVHVIKNNNSSTVALAQDATIAPQVAGWSTNLYEYKIDAAKSNGSSVFDSLKFKAEEATPNSLKVMNNYTLAPTRGFSLLEDAPVYNIAQDLGKTEYGTFTVNGVSAEESIISGYRLSFEENPDGTIKQYNRDENGDYIVTDQKGSFFELTEQNQPTTFYLNNITIQDAERTNSQTIKDGSVIYSASDKAEINVESVNIKNNTSAGNGGAFAIENAKTVVIKDSLFDGNKSTNGQGGAIQSLVDLYISNTSFTNNTDINGKNDINLGNNTNLTFNVANNTQQSIDSGVSGEIGSKFDKIGEGTLNLSGVNKNYNGTINLLAGNINYIAKDSSDSFFENAGISLSDGTNLFVDTSDKTDLGATNLSGTGDLYKEGTKNLTVTGNNSDFKGNIYINDGELTYSADAGTAAFFDSESIVLAGGTKLNVDTNGKNGQTGGRITSNNDTSTEFNKNGQGDFLLIGDNSGFSGTANINEGSLSIVRNNNNKYFTGKTNINAGAVLNYTIDTLTEALTQVSGSGIINKLGTGVIDFEDYTFNGTVNVVNGTFNAISSKNNANNFDFTANVGDGTKFDYTAGNGSSIKLGGTNNKLTFKTENSGATAIISDANITLDLIQNVTGNNVIINNSSSTILNQEDYTGGIYTINNSTLKLLDNEIKDYIFSSLTAGNDKAEIDISLKDTPLSDNFTVSSGSGVISISDFNIMNDSKLADAIIPGQTSKLVQVIHNGDNSTLSLVDTAAADVDTDFGAWATSFYEYNISAAKSDQTKDYYDSLEFLITQETDPNTLKKMNQYKLGQADEGEKLRGFTVGENSDSPYHIAQDLESTAKGTFKVQGQGKDVSVISGQRAEYTVGPDGKLVYTGNLTDEHGSMFEVTQASTDLQVKDLTIKDAARTNQAIKDGSVLYITKSNASFENVLLDNNSASGNGGAIAVSNASLDLKNTDFTNNSAVGNGGALSNINGNLNISGSNIFTSNKAEGYGGALSNKDGTVKISGTNEFRSNEANNGGAIYNTSQNLTITGNTSFINNIATANGGAVYNEGKANIENAEFVYNRAEKGAAVYNGKNGVITLTNPVFDSNFGSSYIHNNGTMTITAVDRDLNLQNYTDAVITNNGVLNLNNTINIYDAIDSETRGIINAKGNISVFNTVTKQDINLTNGTLVIGANNNTNTDALLNNTNLVINSGTTATLNNNSVNSGSIQTDGVFNIVNTSYIDISSDLSGSGEINKTGYEILTFSGKSNENFSGTLNVNEGIVQFNKTTANTFFDKDAQINVADNAIFSYSSTGSAEEFSADTFSKVTLNENSAVNISGENKEASHYTISDGWLTSESTINNIEFSNANYLVSNSFINNENHKGNLIFTSSIVNFEIDNNAAGPKDYTITSNNYTLNESILDLTNKIAGDNYNFDSLDMNKDSKIGLDVNLNLDLDNPDIKPYADTITSDNGSGTVEITKLYITADNGVFEQDGSGKLSKGIIQVFKGNNTLQVAEENDAKILSWATNLYKYGITSAETQRTADSIKIIADGYSNYDTLRDMNIYDPEGDNSGGNRGFSFLNDGSNTPYYIYRDLDTTSAGNFTILGAPVKSILSGELKPLEISQQDAGDKLVVNPDGSITFDNVTLQQDEYETFERNDLNGNPELVYRIPTSAFGGTDTNGSMFELVNNTIFEMENVLVQDAKRYSDDTITDGSVIYTNNSDTTVSLNSVDMVNNSVEAGNGGAIANYLSQKFVINNSIISNNTAYKNGGAVYNLSEGFHIENATLDGNSSTDGLGGAIYTEADMHISNSNFGVNILNTQNSGKNDIYIANNANVEFETTGNNESTINSGLAGNGSFTKTGEGKLYLNGTNKDFTGKLAVNLGELEFTAANIQDSFVNAAETQVDGILTMNIAQNLNANINNLSGSGTLNKNEAGNINLNGENKDFSGEFNINNGTVFFTKDDTTSYISGSTNLDTGAILDYTTNSDDTLENVSGKGLLIKNGDKTLNIQGQTPNTFDINMQVNEGTLNYTAAADSNIVLDSGTNPKVYFGSKNQNATIQLNNGTYDVRQELTNSKGNNIIFSGSTIKLAANDYSNGNYTINDSVIDLINEGKAETTTFENLTTSGSSLKIDVNLTDPKDQSDRLVANNGGGDLELILSEINLNDKNLPKYDNGLMVPERVINVLGEKLIFNNNDSITQWATDAYIYDVKVRDKDIVLNAIAASDNNSLKAMNQYKQDEGGGNRGFQFNDQDNPYIIADNLGTTSAGSFTVKGVEGGNTVISGQDNDGNAQHSFFEVTNKTNLTVKDVTIEKAKGEAQGGSVVFADNQNANIKLNNVNMDSSTSTGNGGVINNTNSNSFSISGGNVNNNTSSGLGGAIYTKDNMTITDTNFGTNGLNYHNTNVQNDIYIDGKNTVVNYITNNESTISSGIAGNGTLNKAGSDKLNLTGNNKDFTGKLIVNDGTLSFEQTTENDTYITGGTHISQNGTVAVNANKSDLNTGAFSGNGTLDKAGSNKLVLSGDNSQFTGTANIKEGEVEFTSSSSSDRYLNGTTNISEDGILTLNTGVNTAVSNLRGNGTVNKNGDSALILGGNNSNFTGDLNINSGIFGMSAGSSLGTLNSAAFADGTAINLQNTSVINNGNNNFTTNPNPSSLEHLSFNKLTLNGDVGFNIDVDLKAQKADSIYAKEIIGDGRLVIGQGSLNVVSDTLLKDSIVQVASGAFKDPAYSDRVALDSAVTSVMGPIQKYNVAYGNGALSFSRQGGLTPSMDMVNPSVMASSVATQVGGYLSQLQTLNAGFYHMDRYTKYPHLLRLTSETSNRNALIDTPAYQRSRLPETSNAMWVQPYTTFEQVQLRGGIGVSNVSYGALYGGDSNLVDLGHGFKGVLSTFVGYNGSHQAYNGVSMNQQGGTLGVTGTLYKGNFFTGLTLSTGASAGDAYTAYGTDHFAMITAGAASKTGYNWELKEGKVIIQPSLFLGYTFVNTFDYTNSAGVKIDSDPLNAIQVVPGIKIIGNLKNGWQPYLGVNMVWSIMDKTNVMANDVRLPQLSVKPYVEYGVGVQKSWGERFTAFFQTMLRNGGRTGVALTAGFRWSIGKDYPKETVLNNTPAKKKVIKSLKG